MNRLKILVLLLWLTSCAAPIGQGAAISSSPTADEHPTLSPTATITPTATIIPTLTIPPLDTTDKGYSLVVLVGPEGALYRLGMGLSNYYEIAVSPDSRLLALPASTGLYVYTAGSLELVWATSGISSVGPIAWSPDGSRVTCLHSDHGEPIVSVFKSDDGSLLHQFPVDLSGAGYFTPSVSIDISPDNRLVFVREHLYDVESGKEVICVYCTLYDITGYSGFDIRLAFTADSVLRAAFPCEGGALCLWESDTRLIVPYALSGVEKITPAVFSPDGNWLLVRADNTVRMFDVQAKTFQTLPELTDAAFEGFGLGENDPASVMWAPDSHAFYLISDDAVYWFRVGEATSVLNWSGIRYAATWSPDSSMLLVGSTNSDIYAADGKLIREMKGSIARVLLDDGTILWGIYGGGYGGSYSGLLSSRGDEADYDHVLATDIDLGSVGWTPDNLLMTVSGDSRILFFDGATGDSVATVETGLGLLVPASEFQWSADGRHLVWQVETNIGVIEVLTWDRATGELNKIYDSYDIESLALHPDGRRLLVGLSRQPHIALLNVETGEILRTAGGLTEKIDLAWSPDGSQFVSLDNGDNDVLVVWDAESFEPEYVLMPEWEWLPYLSFLTVDWAGDIIAALGWTELSVWQASTHSLLWSASLEEESAASCEYYGMMELDNRLALSPDGRYLAVITGGAAQGCERIAVYEAHTGRLLHHYPGNGTSIITQLVWSPNGRYLASVSQEDTIVVWDTSLLPEVELP